MQQYAGIYLLQNYSTCFRRLSHPSSGVHKTAASEQQPSDLIRPCWQKVVALTCDMTCTRTCSYNLMYSWWWVR